ncbi:hypothetical protein HDV00_001993 [Rhizophlyctis rosea]|nr:hypothetical protein HDV00_001993 [Rhizophlyctis rosea]
MFSWFTSKKAHHTKNSLLSQESAAFLETYSTTPHSSTETLKEEAPRVEETRTPPILDGTVTRIVTDYHRMKDEKTFKQMRWKVPEGVSASSVAKKCSSKCGAKFLVENVGSLSYVTVRF